MEKNERKKPVQIADIKSPNYLQTIEECIKKGKSCLMPDVGQELDPVLDSVLNKSYKSMSDGRCFIKIGEKEIDYNKKFRLYITTRMSNPVYAPEISTKVNVINFSIKESGLEEILLGIVVECEQPNWEKSKLEQIRKIASSQKELIQLEDKILDMIQNSKVSLIEDVELAKTLATSKEISENTTQILDQARTTMKKIDEA